MTQEMKVALVADVAGFSTDVRQAGVLYDRFGKQIVRTSENIESATQATNRSFNNLGRVSGAAGASVLSFSRIIQDAPFGIIGVGNNITQLVESFGALRASSKSTGAAMKSFFTSLIAPGNLLVLAISAATTALTIFSLRSRTAAKDTETLAQAIGRAAASAIGEAQEISALVSVARNDNLTREQRQQAIDRLNDSYPDLLGNLNLETINTNKATEAINKQIRALINKSKAEALVSRITEKQTQLSDLNTQSMAENTNAWDFIVASIKGGGNALNGFFELYERGTEKTKEDTKALQGEINGLVEDLEALFAEGAGEGTLNFEKATKSARDNVEGISNTLKSIDSPIAAGIVNATQKFDKGLSDAISRAAQQLSGSDFVDALNKAQQGIVPQSDIQTDLRGPKGQTGFVDSGILAEEMARIQEFSRGVSQTFGDMYASLLIDGEDAFDNINRLFDRMIKRMISDLISSGLTKAFTSILGGAIGGGGGFLGGLFKGIFGGIPKLASGGILSGPSLVLAGEYPGARSNPEVIAPLNDLKKYGVGDAGNINVVIEGKVQGPDIYLAVERVFRDYNRRN